MKVFLIHSFSDKSGIAGLIYEFKKYRQLELISLKDSRINLYWKAKARKEIHKSKFVIFFVGESSHTSKNIKWELMIAKKAKKKIYIVKLDDDFLVSDEEQYIKIITVKELDNIIEFELDANKRIEKTLFNNKELEMLDIAIAIESKKILFEEYKLLLQTSENLIARRQIMNTFFLTANGVLFSMLGLITSALIKKDLFIYQATVVTVGALLCISWRSLIMSYGQLNTGKFAVLNKLERYLPVSIFSAEWVALGEGKDKRIYKSFTKSEKIIPILFLSVYILLLIAIIAIPTIKVVVKWYRIIRTI